jgi:hypothetical protein
MLLRVKSGLQKFVTEQRCNFGCRDVIPYAYDYADAHAYLCLRLAGQVVQNNPKHFKGSSQVMPRDSNSRGFGPALILLVTAIAMLVPRKGRGASKFCPTDRPRLRILPHRISAAHAIRGASRSAAIRSGTARMQKRHSSTRRLRERLRGVPTGSCHSRCRPSPTFTHTATDMDTAGSAPYLKANNNLEFQTASLFYGGGSPTISAYSPRPLTMHRALVRPLPTCSPGTISMCATPIRRTSPGCLWSTASP